MAPPRSSKTVSTQAPARSTSGTCGGAGRTGGDFSRPPARVDGGPGVPRCRGPAIFDPPHKARARYGKDARLSLRPALTPTLPRLSWHARKDDCHALCTRTLDLAHRALRPLLHRLQQRFLSGRGRWRLGGLRRGVDRGLQLRRRRQRERRFCDCWSRWDNGRQQRGRELERQRRNRRRHERWRRRRS